MKRMLWLAIAGLGVCAARAEVPTGNGYDVLSRLVQSFEGVVFGSGDGPKALEMILSLDSEGESTRIKAAFQYPEKLFLDVDSALGRVRVWRDGGHAWVEPATLAALMPKSSAASNLAQRAGLEALTSAQLQFLPALLKVENPSVPEIKSFGDVPCRVVAFSALPELANRFGWTPHRVTAWLEEKAVLRRIEISEGGRQWVVDVKRWRWARSLPPAVWRPSPEADACPVEVPALSSAWGLLFPAGQ